MEAVGLLAKAVEKLWDAVQRYKGNKKRLSLLGMLVKNTMPFAEAAAVQDPSAATPVILSLVQHIQQAETLVRDMSRMNTVKKMLNSSSLQDALENVTTGIRDCLAAFSAANFCLLQQYRSALSAIQSKLQDLGQRRQQDDQKLLDVIAAQGERSTAMLLDIAQAWMERSELTPRELAIETQDAMSSSNDNSGQERQVGVGI
jgi:hypothetical protein